MDDYLKQIESAQFGSFKDTSKIKVYLFNDKMRYFRFRYNTGASTLGGATTKEVLISLPQIRERLSSELCQVKTCQETVGGILLHELSHIHTRQYFGSWRYVSKVPQWYHEGLAALVSDGAGAGLISEADAKRSILSGSHLLPHDLGRILNRQETVGDLRFGSFRFYRQAKMVVEFLQNKNPAAFKKTLEDIRAGHKFRTVWDLNYGADIDDLWESFAANI